MQLLVRPLDRPTRSLLLIFSLWKTLLLLVAITSPGPGYDTSTDLAFASSNTNATLPVGLHHVAQRLTRWDGIYFVTIAARDYVHEQEWAFGYGFTKLIALCTSGVQNLGVFSYDSLESIVASIIAHVAHLLSTIILFKLTIAVFGRDSKQKAFVSATLHILAPAGLFLSAPYAESCCAFLSFAGYLYYVKSFSKDGIGSAAKDVLLLMSGIMFGAATTHRSNGMLNGVLLLEEAFRLLYQFTTDFKLATLRRLLAAGVGGISVGAGFVLPQYLAYQDYCKVAEGIIERREWCGKTIPSIYNFVQDHYWDVGPFRYWKLSNLPLFLLAAPMYFVLTASTTWAIRSSTMIKAERKPTPNTSPNLHTTKILRSLVVPQILLIILNLTTAHVQIISRISSAYPVWLWYGASLVKEGKSKEAGYFIRFAIFYAVVQGGLFASFLPPA